jgi:uncharacterized membrane protein HdeD (DUF308 family)
MSTQTPIDPEQFRTAVASTLRKHSTVFLIEGVVLLVLGALAILLPPFATLAVTIIFGWIILFSGLIGWVTTLGARGAPGFWWSLVSAVLATAAGLILLIRPMGGAISLTLLLIAFFAIEGIASIMFAVEHRRQLSGRWEWMLLSGVIDLVLAVIIFVGLPGTAAWALGVLVGVNLIFGGAALIAMAMHARNAT